MKTFKITDTFIVAYVQFLSIRKSQTGFSRCLGWRTFCMPYLWS